MIRYMWPSFLKHLIDITSFILISVHNFHQIFHLKTYISTFYVHDFNWKRESILSWISMYGSWKFSQLICFNQLSYMLKSLTQIYEKNWIDVDTNAVLRLTQTPKQLFERPHQLIFNYSWRCRLAKYCFQKKNQCIQSPGFPIPNCPFKQGSWNFPEQCSWWCWYLYWRWCF